MADKPTTRAAIEFVHDARVLPLTFVEPPRDGLTGRFDGSVHYADGAFCPQSAVNIAMSEQLPADAGVVDWKTIAARPGRHVFGGLLNNIHFGHFVTESLVRLWAFDHLGPPCGSAVFYRYNRHVGLGRFVAEMLDLLIPGVAVTILDAPARFDLLAVPQEIKHGSYIHGHPLSRQLCRRLVAAAGPAEGARKIYVSRSRLPVINGGFVHEDLVDDCFRAEGYTVLHPETMPIRDQIRAYRAADHLVFADGSAVHLYALVARPDQHVFAVWRRGIYTIFDWQIGTFGGPKVQGKPAITELWVPAHTASNLTFAKAVLDFPALAAQLHEAGFIASTIWPSPPEAEIRQRLAALAAANRCTYIQAAIPE